MHLAAYLHRLDPFAIEFSPGVGVRWYGLSYIAGFIVAYLIIRTMAKRERALVKPDRVGDLIIALALGTVIGGRLGYVLLYKPAMLLNFTDAFPYWDVLALNRGGMASHGGVIGIVVACCWFAHRQKIAKLHVLDLAALASTVGIFFGRLANFVNGELYGRIADASFPWATKFPQEMSDWLANYADGLDPDSTIDPQVAAWSEQKLRSLGDVVGQIGVSPAEWSLWIDSYATDQAAQYELGRSIDQMAAMTQLTTPAGDAMAGALAPLLEPRHPSQLYQAGLEGLALLVLFALIWIKPRKPGVIGGAFLWGYATVRILGEQFRMPDQHLGYQLLGLTRGQWISVAMLGIGIALAVYWSRRDVEKIGGWKAPPVNP